MPTAYEFDRSDKGQSAQTGERTGQAINETFECLTTGDPAPSAVHVLAALADQLGVYKGASHPDYPWALCTDIDSGERLEPNFWKVKAKFSEPAPQPGRPLTPGGASTPGGGGTGGVGGGQPAPQDRPPQISGSFRRTEEYYTKDLDGFSMVNAVRDPFDDLPPRQGALGVINLTKWYAEFDYALFMSYLNKCNSATWRGFVADMLLITGVDWNPKTERGWLGVEVKFTLEHKQLPPAPVAGQTGGWIPTLILDRGWNCRAVAGGPVESARSIRGEQLAAPVLLAADGTKLAAGAAVRYAAYRQYDRVSYAILD